MRTVSVALRPTPTTSKSGIRLYPFLYKGDKNASDPFLSPLLFDSCEDGAGIYAVAFLHFDCGYPAVSRRFQFVLHFHGFDHQNPLPCHDFVPHADQYANDLSRHGSCDRGAAVRVGRVPRPLPLTRVVDLDKETMAVDGNFVACYADFPR